MKAILVLAAVGFLAAACVSVLASTPRSITIRGVSNYTLAEATETAQSHCSGHGRDAEMIPDDRPDGNVTFRCVDR